MHGNCNSLRKPALWFEIIQSTTNLKVVFIPIIPKNALRSDAAFSSACLTQMDNLILLLTIIHL
jgi:hypothetical protein